MSTSTLSFFFEVPLNSVYIGTPTALKTKNDLDQHGLMLDLRRLPSELSDAYYRRLRSVFPLRAGPHQTGLVHGITRELGLEEKTALKIAPLTVDGRYTAPSPRVDITATKIVLYSNYVDEDTYTIDVEVDVLSHGDGYLLTDLLDELQQAEFFEVELGSGMTGQEKSNGLIPGSSTTNIYKEVVSSASFFYLDNSDIIPGTLSFQDRSTFETEVSSDVGACVDGGLSLAFSITTPVIEEGQFFVDYKEGLVWTYSRFTGRTTCRYAYRDFPFRARWSPVAVYNLRDTEYRGKVFETETTLDNASKEGVVTDLGRQIYTQIFIKSPSLWGK